MRKATLTSAIVAGLLALGAIVLSGNAPDAEALREVAAERPPDTGKPEVTARRTPAGKQAFDHYILALSWSPTWCADNDPQQKSAQCDPDNDHGFIVHGLWPERDGADLAFCPSREPDRVPQRLIDANFDIMPSAGLAGHQWRKHGTCSGLGQTGYFEAIRQARRAIELPKTLARPRQRMSQSPDAVEAAFRAANPGLPADGIIVTCDKGLIEEVRICMSADFGFIACPPMERRACRMKRLDIPPIP